MTDDTKRMAIGDFLLRRLEEARIEDIFGVPGDFNLELMQQLEDSKSPNWVGNCNELNAAYAADGYARLTGLGALIVTNGVGALSAMNGIAGSYSEHVPVICICGSLPLKAIERDLMMHHTFADGSRNNFLRAFSEITAAQAQLTPQNAVTEIDRVITTAWQQKLPVYLELPSDIAYLEIEVPGTPLVLALPASDQERLESCTRAIVARLSNAEAPAILLDADAERLGLAGEVTALAGKLGLPIATMSTCKGVVDETSPNFVGTYSGGGSSPAARQAVEKSDCLLTFGFRRIDSTTGFFSDALPATAIHFNNFSVDVDHENYQAVTTRDVLHSVIETVPSPTNRGSLRPPIARQATTDSAAVRTGKLTQVAYWESVQRFLREGDVIVAENGTSTAGTAGLQLPPNCTYVSQAVWGSIGYSLGSLLGALVAAPDRRQLLFIGDGSFQLTAQELSTILRLDLKPVIFLINNGGYTIERTILGKTARYNDVANWAYATLPKAFCPNTTARSFVVSTVEALEDVLAQPHDTLVFLEVIMEPDDAPTSLIRGGHSSADLDYGPRGPQHQQDMQISENFTRRTQ
jgi:indolepyruvate decarboxylase